MKTKLFISALMVALLSGCATLPAGPSVMAWPGPGQAFEAFQQDDGVCRQWAEGQAGASPDEAANETLGTGMAVGAVAGAVCGLLAMVMQRFLICAATAFGGAFRVALAAACFVDGVDWQACFRNPELTPSMLASRWWVPVLMLGLGLCGLLVQLRSTESRRSKAE